MITRVMAFCFLLAVGAMTAGVAIGMQKSYAQNDTLGSTSLTLEKAWESPSQLRSPESVAYDHGKGVLYVSNVDGKPDDKDGKGFVTILSSTNGSIISLDWVTGLNAPKGIDFDNGTGKLYVSDITDLVEINSSNGKVVNRYPALENSSLNDVAVDKKGNVFVSDPPNNAIFKLDTGNTPSDSALQIWVKSKDLNGPNGIMLDYGKNRLVVASMGKGTPESGGTIKAVGIDDKKIANVGKEGITVPVGILDGLQMSGDGNAYYASDWNAKNIHIIDASGKGYHHLFSQQMGGIADFRLIAQERLLVIPLMPEGKVIAFQVKGN